MLVNERAGSAELDRLAGALQPPCQLGDFTLEGLIARTSTALVFIARDSHGADCVLKITGSSYRPVLERELSLLNACRDADLRGVIRPLRTDLLHIENDEVPPATAIVLPFLAGGDLVLWIGAHATRTGRLGAAPALQVGELVGGILRDLLRLPQPIVQGDVKPQNVLLPRPDAPLNELLLIDFDASCALDSPISAASPQLARQVVGDVNAFGELLFMVATGREPPVDEDPNPATGNTAFDALVERCITAEPATKGYASMAGDSLWRDMEQAARIERRHSREVLIRPVLGVLGVLLFCVLVVAVLVKLAMP
ncbi:MAG: hypothetical protein JO020_28975 [Chloroflexi bacterium]|nr:hypothetical protein [Chloroflexota bacterium]MBV9898209.1 hypothetical protein [Chloroflexota bacterium]